jgi:hypothetical protein
MHPLLPWLFAASVALHGGNGDSIAADSVRSATGVRDPVFAYLTGLVDSDLYGSIDAGVLKGVITRAGGSSKLPYQYLNVLTRGMETRGHTARVEATFNKPLAIPIPYQILGYHPGKLRSSQTVKMREWLLGDTIFGYEDKGKKKEVRLSDIHLFAILDGTLWVDIDGWLDRMVGGKLDDTQITGLVLFQSGGERYGMAVGYNRKWEGRSGLLSLREDEIRFPSPPDMKVAAWRLRQILEGLEPSCRPDSLRLRASG